MIKSRPKSCKGSFLNRTLLVLLVTLFASVSLTALGRTTEDWFDRAPPLSYGGPFSLTDHNGRAVTEADYLGEFLLIYFGYTYCPDVCPASLATLAAALYRMDELSLAIRPLFISVDVKRDTPEVLADYVKAFSPRMVGLTGTRQQIHQVVRAYHAHYFAGELDGRYLVDHTGSMYLVGPDGDYLKDFPHGISVDELIQEITAAIASYKSTN